MAIDLYCNTVDTDISSHMFVFGHQYLQHFFFVAMELSFFFITCTALYYQGHSECSSQTQTLKAKKFPPPIPNSMDLLSFVNSQKPLFMWCVVLYSRSNPECITVIQWIQSTLNEKKRKCVKTTKVILHSQIHSTMWNVMDVTDYKGYLLKYCTRSDVGTWYDYLYMV